MTVSSNAPTSHAYVDKDVAGSASMIKEQPLKIDMKFVHHCMSRRIAGEMTHLWCAADNGRMASNIRRRNTLPPYITPAAIAFY